jgi:hypothetical protein
MDQPSWRDACESTYGPRGANHDGYPCDTAPSLRDSGRRVCHHHWLVHVTANLACVGARDLAVVWDGRDCGGPRRSVDRDRFVCDVHRPVWRQVQIALCVLGEYQNVLATWDGQACIGQATKRGKFRVPVCLHHYRLYLQEHDGTRHQAAESANAPAASKDPTIAGEPVGRPGIHSQGYKNTPRRNDPGFGRPLLPP